MSKGGNQGGLALQERVKTRAKRKKPPMYKVLLHNDDYTPMEFVVMILRRFFHMSPAMAETVMLAVHHQGIGVAGVYTKDVAETKVAQVLSTAKRHGHPLLATMEEDQPPEDEDEP